MGHVGRVDARPGPAEHSVREYHDEEHVRQVDHGACVPGEHESPSCRNPAGRQREQSPRRQRAEWQVLVCAHNQAPRETGDQCRAGRDGAEPPQSLQAQPRHHAERHVEKAQEQPVAHVDEKLVVGGYGSRGPNGHAVPAMQHGDPPPAQHDEERRREDASRRKPPPSIR